MPRDPLTQWRRLEKPMTGNEASRFVDHLRQNNHLTKTTSIAEQGGDRSQGGKLWEHTNLSASEFAEEAARFHDLERVTLTRKNCQSGESLTKLNFALQDLDLTRGNE